MSAAVVCAKGVAKRFSLKGLSLRAVLSRFLGGASDGPEPFWALRDVSFAVAPGEIFGVIGANGAGKSTLLKLLAGVLPATRGQLEVRGRVAPLIEVGAGFHPELTGRENLFLNGSIMGLSRRELQRKFDAIVHFSGLEPFLDVAVKRYSSGMYVRLGFAIAVHAEPQLLLVDEVLAVGDQSFQHACLQRIREMRDEGTAIVLVSHNLFSITGMCGSCLLLDRGLSMGLGPSHQVVRQYEALVREREMQAFADPGAGAERDASAGGPARILEARVAGAPAGVWPTVRSGDDLRVLVRISASCRLTAPVYTVGITRSDGVCAGASNTRVENATTEDLEGERMLELELPRLRLVPGAYRMDVAICDHAMATEWDRRQIYFEVNSDVANLDPTFYGSFLLDHRWRIVSPTHPVA